MNKYSLTVCALALCLAGAGVHADGGVYILPYGQVIDRSGNIVSEGNTVAGESGDRVVGSDGKIYSASDLKVDSRGKLVTRSGDTFKPQQRDSSNYGYPNLSSKFKSSSSSANARTGSAPVSGSAGNQSSSNRDSSNATAGQSEAAKPRRSYAGPGVELVVGGSSENGVARIGKLPIIP